jgi:predicted GNAT family N-acyltransferase
VSRGGFRVRSADWSADGAALRHVRRAVFIEEQGVPEELEWDQADAACRHALAVDDSGAPVGVGRLLPDGHVGRLAVLASWRGRGVGAALFGHLLAVAAERGHRRVVLNAQVAAVGFYERHGFVASGEQFLEAGIAHLVMQRDLDPGEATSGVA